MISHSGLLTRRSAVLGAATVLTGAGLDGVAAATRVMTGAQSAQDGLIDAPVTLIGLPYLLGRREPTAHYAMATAPIILLSPANAPAALRTRFRDVAVDLVDDVDEPDTRHLIDGKPSLIEGDEMTRMLAQAITMSRHVRAVREQGRLPICSIGTCSGGMGIVGGIGDATGPIGMIFFDTHADASTPETSRTGFIEGMAASLLAGKCHPAYTANIPGFRPIAEENIVTVGLGTVPKDRLTTGPGHALGTPVHALDINRVGVEAALAGPLDALRARCSQVYVHIDADCMSTKVMTAIRNYSAEIGLSDDDVRQALSMIADRFEMLAVAFSSFDPTADARSLKIMVRLILEAATSAARSRGTI